jgi:GntR family histidine utilization transcriptional repressor
MKGLMTNAMLKKQPATRHNAPLYANVKQMILGRIHSGEWPPEHRVPSENELVAGLGVSKMTANRALRELANEGELVRIRGVGSFVAARKGHSTLFEVRNIADEIVERGHVHSASVILLAQEKASCAVAEALELQSEATVFHSVIVHNENGIAVQLEDRFVNPVAAPAYLSQDFTTTTPNAYLSINAPLSGSEHIVEAAMPSAQERKLLDIQRTEPCLAIRRRTWSGENVVSLVHLVYPGNRYRLESRTGTTPDKA